MNRNEWMKDMMLRLKWGRVGRWTEHAWLHYFLTILLPPERPFVCVSNRGVWRSLLTDVEVIGRGEPGCVWATDLPISSLHSTKPSHRSRNRTSLIWKTGASALLRSTLRVSRFTPIPCGGCGEVWVGTCNCVYMSWCGAAPACSFYE